jgi:hypothetical protein
MQRQHKDYLSDFKYWNQKSHATVWLLFPKNMGSHLSLDETAFSNGDQYTIRTNKKAKGKKRKSEESEITDSAISFLFGGLANTL